MDIGSQGIDYSLFLYEIGYFLQQPESVIVAITKINFQC